MNNYVVTVTMYVSGDNVEEATDKVYNVLDAAYCGIDSYSIDDIEE